MKIEKLIEKALSTSSDNINESYNVASEFEKLAKNYKQYSDLVCKKFIDDYKEFLNKVDAINDNKEKIKLRDQFEGNVEKSLEAMKSNLMLGLVKITAHIP